MDPLTDRVTLLLDGTGDTAYHAVETVARILRAGGLVAFPTETVYGLGASATDAVAIAALFHAKGRPADNPMIVHVDDIEEMSRCAVIDRRVETLVARFMPGPLTLVLPGRPAIPSIARGGLPTVAVRIPDHPLALHLIAEAGPLVAPSANRSGRPSPTRAAHVMADLAGRIDAVIDGGPCRVGIESTVLDLSGATPQILRPGRITHQEIEEALEHPIGTAVIHPITDAPRAPGMKYRHYAPEIPVTIVIAAEPPTDVPEDAMILTTLRHRHAFANHHLALLTDATLYEFLRSAEADGYASVIVYAEPGELSEGVIDRLRKAEEG